MANTEIEEDIDQTVISITADTQTPVPLDVSIDETPEDDGAVAAKPDELEALRKELADEKKLRADAESRASSLHAEKNASESRLATEVNGRFAAQEQAIDARAVNAKNAIANIKADMVRAQSEQRYEDVADLQEKMADAKLEEKSAAWDKQQITQHKARLTSEMEAATTRNADPVESFLSTIPGGPSRQWLRNHPDILSKAATSDSDKYLLFAAAQKAQGRGHSPDSASYFDFIEQELSLKEAEPVVTAQPEPKPAPKPPGRTANAAPSSRSASPSATTRTVTLDDVVRKLTPLDRQNAKVSFPDKKEDEALKLFAQGLVISKQREPGFRPDIKL